ncbi:hypothetical protein ACFV4F_28135 [Kitasatospora sp. NPDC059722]|uniref:hypothetical protein n=1 Tax=Kitasatospora sp. NPDC059722 TaxID=3346925 RepID=UPI0036CB5240
MTGAQFREFELTRFLLKLLKASGYSESAIGYNVNFARRIDILMESGGEVFIIEVKRAPPQTDLRIDQVVDQIRSQASRVQSEGRLTLPQRLVLATPGSLSPKSLEVLQASGIEVWDGPWIARMSESVGLASEAAAFLAPENFSSALDGQPTSLASRLSEMSPGRATWSSYQKLCREIFEYLFCPPLQAAIWESSNESKVNKRDFILPNYATDGFWRFLREEYRADYIVVDAKNYAAGIEKEEVLQIANYLSRHGAGLFAIIMTRNKVQDSAAYIIREQWILHSKLLVPLDDRDVLQMLTDKSRGNDPGELIRQKIEDFRLGI